MAPTEQRPSVPNVPAKGISYFTPAQDPPAGTASDPQPNGAPIPKLFTPLKIRGTTFQNRIVVSPMCQYSADDGHLTDWHVSHLGGMLMRGPGLTIIEATAVLANGRITPEDSGLWKDSQIAPLKRVVEFAHSQGQKIGIQLAHAGRKASTVAPWLSGALEATRDVGGWPDDVWGPDGVPFAPTMCTPSAVTPAQIEQVKEAFAAAVRRAVAAGFDVIEIHGAHGYLLSSFTSPASNTRTDDYGGSFDNRTRLVREVVQLARANMPADMPLFLRISATDWLQEVPEVPASWTPEDTVRLAPVLAGLGVDLLDVSSGGNHVLQHIHAGPGFQAPFAKQVKQAVGDRLLVSAVGMITQARQAQELLTAGDGSALDIIMVGRPFQRNPGFVRTWAEELGVEVREANQIRWGFAGRKMPPKKEQTAEQ